MMETTTLADILEEGAVTDTKTVESTHDAFLTLDATHRCDGCGAAAVAQVLVSESLPVVLLCGHHFRKNMIHFSDKSYPVLVPDEYNYQFTGREVAARPVDHRPRDAGSAPV